ncbi:hypothetical protein CEE45_05590 [Candidatus Heimdallarchaeota archaeon B3_Heim]|nr:MAG: hypothetical protein CEE45_05590 [Candidatus Heimdallarchaeota archaeon B3_Heim]
MAAGKTDLLYIFLGLVLTISVFASGTGKITQITTNVQIPSVGLVGTWMDDTGYNETFEIVNENATHFILDIYGNDTIPITSYVSKAVWIDYSYLWEGIMGWPGWISVNGLTIGEKVTVGDSSFEVVSVDYLTTPLGTYSVYIVNATDGRSYNYGVNTGFLLGYRSGSSFHFLTATNGDLSKDSYQGGVHVPFVGFRAVYLLDGGVNETVVITGENSSHYFVDLFTDGILIDQSFISKFIWMDRVYLWNGIMGWPIWINVTDLTLGQNVTLGIESYEVIDKTSLTVPVGDFVVWNISRTLENRTYWYEVSSGLLIAYAFPNEYHYLAATNAVNETESTTTEPLTTTSPPTTTTPGTETTTTEPETTEPLISSTTTASSEDSTSDESETTTSESDSSITNDSTVPSLSPGFSLPVGLITIGIIFRIIRNRKKK